ncbi:hypothetical protein [Shewanella algae]|uniref:hypothetical protein n=1 Tax=Shewanella algae TaxID=38313 RepID=UPI001BEE2CB7|nr:hypothetical protein TUM17382_07980 [Shewanella algae]
MPRPPKPLDEPLRLATLQGLGVLDTEAEERFDRISRMAQRLFEVPICLVSLVDAKRQWFKSSLGKVRISPLGTLAYTAIGVQGI